MRHIKKALSYSMVGSLGLVVVASLHGCSDPGPGTPDLSGFDAMDAGPEQNQFLVIEQTGSNPDSFRLVEQHPTSGPSRAILRNADGTERFLSEAELKQIAAEEAARVEAGTSRLTEDPSMHAGGLSLGEMLLATAAGALIGSMLANRLAGNANFQRTQQSHGAGRPTAAISQPARPPAARPQSQPRTGFFSNNSNTSGRSSSSSGSSSFGG